jgi:RNA polymerase sigma-70 factor (sigma-E family)
MDRRRADFDTFVAASTDSLMRTAYLIVGDLQDAEDLVQETLLKVAGRWHRVRRMERPVAYARRILVNRALTDAGRRTRRRRELTGETLPDRVDDADEPLAFDAHEELLKVLATLPTRQRTAIVLRYFLDLPEAEVAAAMKCSLGTVKSTAARGLARLEQALRTTNDKRSIST